MASFRKSKSKESEGLSERETNVVFVFRSSNKFIDKNHCFIQRLADGTEQ